MKIQYNEFVSNPALRNTIAHLPTHICQNLIAQGVARHVPYKNAGEMLSAEYRTGSDPSNANPPQVNGVVWECGTLPKTGRPIIYRKSGGEVARLEDEQQALQYGAPEAILKQYRELTAATGAVNYSELAQRETAKQKAAEAAEAGTWKTLMKRA